MPRGLPRGVSLFRVVWAEICVERKNQRRFRKLREEILIKVSPPNHPGKFMAALGGEEVVEMRAASQAKILRILEEKGFSPWF